MDTMLSTGYRPDAIFLSIAGNNIGFGDIARSCVLSAFGAITTLDRLRSCPASPGSLDAYLAVEDLLSYVPAYVDGVLEQTSSMFGKHQLKTPPIIVLKYPQLLAHDTNAPLRCDPSHPFQDFALGAGFEYFSRLQNQLNGQITWGVRFAVGKGVPAYVAGTDKAIPPDHNLCSADPWFVPLTGQGAIIDESPESLHPIAAGHKAIAAAINSWAADPGTSLRPAAPPIGSEPPWKSATVQWWPTASDIYLVLSQPAATGGPTLSDHYGQTVIHVSGGAPLTGVTLYIHSAPLVLGRVELDQNGNGSLSVDLQATDLPPGDHTVNVLGTAADGKAVVRAVSIHIEQPFPAAFWIMILLGVALASVATTILLKSPRRTRSPRSDS
ncbi:hypothetical protein FCN77_05745 [Arthrobacter sp. 24S4-2]|uniref:hypothetical protein n=1 Tax=Arthrobacter sp. 24S4-2 TaxID=2575374 RepID=UPI0010C7DFB2|nr:hypothetical protein [Arthrobacter sp. 24S4-2]QCO97309.1 hypothetical protein FCN77_05745 [Arthrobacter sp. 24S4-2]